MRSSLLARAGFFMEIERKFLTSLTLEDVVPNMKQHGEISHCFIERHIIQHSDMGYVRVSSLTTETSTEFVLTVKGSVGISRPEFEITLDVAQYEYITTNFTIVSTIRKSRRILLDKFGQKWDIDIFEDGTIMAEIELTSTDQHIILLPFITHEVTHDPNFYAYAGNK